MFQLRNSTPELRTLCTFLLLTLFLTATVNAQTTASLSGKIFDNAGNLLPFSSVTIDTLNKGVVSDEDAAYRIDKVPAGTYRVSAAMIGYKKQIRMVTLNGKSVTLNFSLEEDTQALTEVTITGEKDAVQKTRELPFSVNSIDVVPMQNLNMDVNTVLNRSTGIRIRQDGGLGSDFSFSLNGFSGNQVRFFIDGIPANVFGSTMQFNNIPVNIIERIEVYKGVVPVYLGADALGGAVNIVTSDNAKDFLDVSYGFGSFNTHQAAIASRATFKKNVVINASAFFNYSDNDYAVDAQLVDKNTGKISDPKPFKLFNEDYISGSVMVEAGVVKTKWADRFLIGLVASENEKHYQRGRAMVLNPAGEVFRTDKGITPTLKYQKRNLFVENLSLNVAGVYSQTETMSVDTSSRIYSWDGTYVMREFGSTSGELSWYKTKFRFNDRAAFNTATLEYVHNKRHTFTLNNTYSYFWRKGSDPLASQYDANVAFSDPNTLTKNITGFSYTLGLLDNHWKTMVFAKLFQMKTSVQVQDESEEYYSTTDKTVNHGVGFATSLFVTKNFQLKTSYENTTRLPETEELFGDGLLLQPNMVLKPERSHNFNFDVLYRKPFREDHVLNAEGGFIYRLPEDLIRTKAIGVMSVNENLADTKVWGLEGAVRYSYKQQVSVEVNATYQDMRNNTPPDYDRIPNIPYLFGNAIVGVTSRELTERRLRVGFNWATMFVEEFFLNWPSQGSADTKYAIPRQLSHDVAVSLSSFKGKYNISLACWNVTDSKLYDNFKVQRPGRSFNVKLRFYIDKFKD
ncbi:MAG TPA: TonB-dependent receptor plug domain-containing protein [Ohtaekwangia sp.]